MGLNRIKDGAPKKAFSSGAVRETKEGKGRCDLMPLKQVGEVLVDVDKHKTLQDVAKFMETGDTKLLATAIQKFVKYHTNYTECEAMIDVSKHYEQGAEKHGERNWEKGIPLHSYIDSGVRHFIQHVDGKTDEPHDRAFIWNMLGAMWTVDNKPEFINIDFKNKNK